MKLAWGGILGFRSPESGVILDGALGSMRWLLLKDLQILRRSPLVVGLLIAYPVVLGVLIGFALSSDGSKPRVAFLNLVPESETQQFQIGGEQEGIDQGIARDELCSRVECVNVSTREEAEQKVEDGDVIAALILPEDLLDELESLASLNPQQPTVEVLVNEDDPVKASLVDDRISALVTEANLILRSGSPTRRRRTSTC